MRDLRRKVAYHFGEGGFRGLSRKLASYILLRGWSDNQWLVYERLLAEDLPVVSKWLIRRELTFSQLEGMAYDKALASPEAIMRRFRDRNVCHGFFLGEQLATIGWTSPGYLELDRDLRLSCPGAIGLFDFHTFEQFRSRGCYTTALSQLFVEMRRIGFSQAYIAVDPGNVPSITGIERAGFRLKLRMVRRWRLGVPFVVQDEVEKKMT